MLPLVHHLKSDEALMLAYQGGDAGAFEHLYRRHKDGLFAFLYRHCPRSAVVEELTQDTWMAVVDRAPDYQPQARFRTWLYRIAHNRQVDYWRRGDNRTLPLEAAPEPADDPTADSVSEKEIMAALGALPPDQRDALLLREEGFSLVEIGEICGASEEAIKSRLRYGRGRLRDLLGGDQ